MTMPVSIFADAHNKKYNRRYSFQATVEILVGGIPADPKVAEGWIKKNLGIDNEELIQAKVAETMIERGVEVSEATDLVVANSKLIGFKRDPDRDIEKELYIEGRQVKAAIKESANICWPKRRWGPTSKGTRSYWAEHVFVPEMRIHLGTNEPSGVMQQFVSTWRGTGIQYSEYLEEVPISFTVFTDADHATISDDDWSELWATGEQEGIGAGRSMSYGRYAVTGWELLSKPAKVRKAA